MKCNFTLAGKNKDDSKNRESKIASEILYILYDRGE